MRRIGPTTLNGARGQRRVQERAESTVHPLMVYQRYYNDFEWFYIGGDDLPIIVENFGCT